MWKFCKNCSVKLGSSGKLLEVEKLESLLKVSINDLQNNICIKFSFNIYRKKFIVFQHTCPKSGYKTFYVLSGLLIKVSCNEPSAALKSCYDVKLFLEELT